MSPPPLDDTESESSNETDYSEEEWPYLYDLDRILTVLVACHEPHKTGRDIITGGNSGQVCKSLERLRGSLVEDENPSEALKKRVIDDVESDYLQERSPLFTVHAYMSVGESFGFADELRRWASGAARALLVFRHWEALSEGPVLSPRQKRR